MSRSRTLYVLGTLLACSGCLVVFSRGSVERSDADGLEVERVVTSPMKAFFADGSTAVFAQGGEITQDSIVGRATVFSMGLTDTTEVRALSMDSLVGIEAFQGETHGVASFLASTALTGGALIGSLALFKALFGSCPTFYTVSEDGGVLQAEAFSYSIAPLLEGRDLDATSLTPDVDGVVRVELRNEALETHYINHLDLLAVDHRPGVRVVPNDHGVPIGVVAERPPLEVVDSEDRDLLRAVRDRDDQVFESPLARIRGATSDDPFDHVELSFPRPGAGEAVLVLRARNSLLTTVLFYDMMLADAGVGALDWIGQDMDRIGTVVELGTWFQESMGLRVEVFDDGVWVQAGRVPDTGPIAWEEVGIPLPSGDSELVRIRLRFLTDAWRIDQATLGTAHALRGERRVPVARIVDEGETMPASVLERLAEPDDRYLTTYPGTSALLEFDPPPPKAGLARSYLLASQGYYTEWIRPEWMHGKEATSTFRPDERIVERLMERWLSRKDAFETRFYESRIPVR